MTIIISNNAGIPIYEQIKEQIKTAILSGELKEGEALPSIRQLARELKISVITTTRAYNDLQYEGYVTNVQGKGCFVLKQDNDMLKEQLIRDVEENLSKAIANGKMARLTKRELLDIFECLLKEENYE